jgi:peptidoglycan/xylan/chitin deacetylase (PgdA/CDA1 family)
LAAGIRSDGPAGGIEDGVTPFLRRAGTVLLRRSIVNRAVRALACARNRRLVLVYHRVGPAPPASCRVIPSIPAELFRAHLQALGEIANLVTLDQILSESSPGCGSNPGSARPAVAVTFDDDLPSHVAHALPILREFGVPAAFFLSGRALDGRSSAYWFQHLETLLLSWGEERTAGLLGLPAASVDAIALACERSVVLRRRLHELTADLAAPKLLGRGDIAVLAARNVTIGFHTVDHETLPGLDDRAMAIAVSRGRPELAAAAAMPVRYFAYPHGQADARSAAAVHRAGFDAAFTGRAQPLHQSQNRHLLGRWEPGPLAVDELLVSMAVRLHRAAPIAAQPSA